MALTSYPFANQDTTENQYSLLFREFQNSGIVGNLDGPGFKVSADGSGLDVEVAPGFAIVRGHAVDNSTSFTVGLAAADASARVDLVVLRLDPTVDSIIVAVKRGTAGSSAPPALTQTPTAIYEIALAEVSVAGSALNISNANVNDRRGYSGGQVGAWKTSTRPADPRKFQFGYNDTIAAWEFWTGSAWSSIVPAESGGYREKRVTLAGSGSVSMNLADANTFEITPTGNVSISLVNASSSTSFTPLSIRINNSAYAITWPAGTRFPGGSAPALSGVSWLSGVVDSTGVLTVGTSWTAVA